MAGEPSPLKRRIETIIPGLEPTYVILSSSVIICTSHCSRNFPKDINLYINRASGTKIFIRALFI